VNLQRINRYLPKSIRPFIHRQYWRLKALDQDLNDYGCELVAYIPSHAIRLGWYHYVSNMRIGAGSSVHRKCRIYHPRNIQIGRNSVINYGVLLDGRGGLSIGNNVSVSEGTAIITLSHDIDDKDFSLVGAPVTIGDRVFVGSYARILPGVVLGEGAVVASGSVVTRDVAPHIVVGGVPARYIRDRTQDLRYELDHRKRFG